MWEVGGGGVSLLGELWDFGDGEGGTYLRSRGIRVFWVVGRYSGFVCFW